MRISIFCLTFVVVLCCNVAFAADWSFTPSATLSEKYDSNIDFSASSSVGAPGADFVSGLDAVLSATGTTDSTVFQFDTDTLGEKYVKNTQYDTVNTNTGASLTELWSPRLSTDLNFRFYHDYTLQYSLATSGIVTQRADRFQYNAGGGFTYALGENLSVQAGCMYSDTTYPSHPFGLSDEQAYQVTATPFWSITPLDTVGISSSFSRQEYPTFSAQTDTVTEMLSWKRLLNETTSFELSAGYYYTWSSFVTQVLVFIPPAEVVLANMPGSGTGSGPAANCSFQKQWSERLSTTLTASKSQYSDAYARNFDQTAVGLNASYRLSELTTFNCGASYDLNDQTAQGSEKIDYLNIGPSMVRKITDNLSASLRGSYEYETDSAAGRSALHYDRYSVWIEFTYQWPRFWANH